MKRSSKSSALSWRRRSASLDTSILVDIGEHIGGYWWILVIILVRILMDIGEHLVKVLVDNGEHLKRVLVDIGEHIGDDL